MSQLLWSLAYTTRANKDAKRLAHAGLKPKAFELLNILQNNPYQTPPPFEKLSGGLDKAYSRRINVQHRLVYEIIESTRHVKIIRMWTHYEQYQSLAQ